MIFKLWRTFGRPWHFDDLTALKENQNTMHFGLGQAPPLLNNFGIRLELGRVMIDSGLERRVIQFDGLHSCGPSPTPRPRRHLHGAGRGGPADLVRLGLGRRG